MRNPKIEELDGNEMIGRNALRGSSASNALGPVNSKDEIVSYALIKSKGSGRNFGSGALNGWGEIVDYAVRNERRERRGTFRNSELNGEGEMTYHWGGNERREYRGTFRNNRLDGGGEIIHYHGNGNRWLEMKGIFRDMGLVEGEITFYDEEGRMTRTTDIILPP